MRSTGRPNLQPAQRWHAPEVVRGVPADDHLDIRVGERHDVERRVAGPVDDLELGRQRAQPLDGP